MGATILAIVHLWSLLRQKNKGIWHLWDALKGELQEQSKQTETELIAN